VKKNKIYFLFKKIIIFFFVRQDRHFAEDPPSLQLQVLQLALARGCGYPNPNGKKKSKKKIKKITFFLRTPSCSDSALENTGRQTVRGNITALFSLYSTDYLSTQERVCRKKRQHSLQHLQAQLQTA